MRDIFSNHIGSSSELTVVGWIKEGFVGVGAPLTYAHRLRIHLRMLSALRRSGYETDRNRLYVGPIDALQSLQFIRWTLIEDDTKMLLSVNFDRALEPYIRRIVEEAGPLLDTILCHCEGFDGLSSNNGMHAFMEYAQTHQVPVELFAAANPDFSVDDADYFLTFDKAFRENPLSTTIRDDHARLKLTAPDDRLKRAADSDPIGLLSQAMRIIRVMHENAWRFPAIDEMQMKADDAFFFHRLTDKLVGSFWDLLFHKMAEGLPSWVTSNPDAAVRNRNLVEFLLGRGQTQPTTQSHQDAMQLLRPFGPALLWYAKPPSAPERDPQVDIAKGTIQGGLLNVAVQDAPVHFPTRNIRPNLACMIFLRIDDVAAGAKFLTHIAQLIWSESSDDGPFYTVSVTHDGLKSLRIPASKIAEFPTAFREGMAARAGLLGDTDINHPSGWLWPKQHQGDGSIAPSSIDLIVKLEARVDAPGDLHSYDGSHPLAPAIKSIEARPGITLLAVEPLHRQEREVKDKTVVTGHIGFADGISQPHYGAPATDPDAAMFGDLLVGHPDTQSNGTPHRPAGDLLRDGTFQVLRKLKVDTVGFTGQPPEVQEKMIGRGVDGETLSGMPHYQEDADGAKCPLQSHVRRTNPRDEKTPRILRRGYSFGPINPNPQSDDGEDRGMFFVAYNADLAEQFEVIQRWITGGNSSGISSWQGDPLLAPKRAKGFRNFTYIDQSGRPASLALDPKPWVTLQWGLYAFVPSRKGLETLAAEAGGATSDATGALPALMTAEATPSTAVLTKRWKALLEGADSTRESERAAIWAEVSKQGGWYDTHSEFGVLAGGKETVNEVLSDNGTLYSASAYLDRMQECIGPQFLGRDPGSERDLEKDVFDRFLTTLDMKQLFEETKFIAAQVLNGLPSEDRLLDKSHPQAVGCRLNVVAFTWRVLAQLCVKWFGISDVDFTLGGATEAGKSRCPQDFVAASFYVFGPNPSNLVAQTARTVTPAAVDRIANRLQVGPSPAAGTLAEHLLAQKNTLGWSERKIAEMIAGGIFGFLGPTLGSLRSASYDWITSKRLWRIQQKYNEASPSGKQALLRAEIVHSLARRPIPDLLHRKRKSDGKPVVLSLRQAIVECGGNTKDEEAYVFGKIPSSDPTGRQAVHGCSGHEMALQTMMGCFAALLEVPHIREEGPLTLWLHK